MCDRCGVPRIRRSRNGVGSERTEPASQYEAGAERIIFKKAWRVIRNYSGDLCFSQDSGDIKSCRGVSAGMLGRKGAFDDVCGTVGYKVFDLRIRFDADDYAACDIVCHCI